jgi:hypothetical protein
MMTMTATRDLSPLGALVLLWLSTRQKPVEGQGTRAELDKALAPLLEGRWSGAEQRGVVDEEIDALERAKQLTRGKKTNLVLTDEGRRAGLAALGVTVRPGKGDWRTVKKYLLAPALGFSLSTTKLSAKSVLDTERVRARILKQRYTLRVSDHPTLSQAANALVWRALGVDTKERLTLKAIRTLVLNRELGAVKQQDHDSALAQLAAKAVEATRAGADELQMTVLRRWATGVEVVLPISEPKAANGAAEVVKPTVAEAPVPESDDKAFADRVLTAARTSPTGRFGENKVFISHIFRKLLEEGAIAADSDAFKDRLVAVHRGGLLSLSRADLVGAMDPRDVASSEASYLGATFHFVRI